MASAQLQSLNLNFPAPADGKCDLLFIAGEHSGDEQAAKMLKSFKLDNPQCSVCAFGGEALRDAGAQVLFDMTSFSVVGLFEVLKNYSFFKRLANSVVEWIKKYKPRAICLVDYPGFNLHLAAILKREGISVKGGGQIKLLYYISPQIWAWKARRRFKMAELLDSLAVIFPFEPACYSDTNLDVQFVGHPFLDASYKAHVSYDANGKILLLAGSRGAAVGRIFPIMLRALAHLEGESALAFYPNEAIKSQLEKILKKFPSLKLRVELRSNDSEQVGVKAAMMSSGTMSLACSLEGIPGCIVYKANPFTYAIGRALVSIKYLSIANILLDRPAWREFIQFDASPKKIFRYMKKFFPIKMQNLKRKKMRIFCAGYCSLLQICRRRNGLAKIWNAL